MGKMGGGGWGKEGKGTLDSSGWSLPPHLPPASVLALTVQGGKPRPPILLLLFPRSFSSLLPFAPPFPRVPSHTSQYFLPAARVLCPVRQCAVQFSPAAPIQQPELAQPKAARPSKTKVTPFPFPFHFPQCHPSSLPPPVAVDRRVPGFPAKTSAKGALLPHNHSPIVKRLLGPPPYVSLPLLFPIQISHSNPPPIQTTLSQYTHTTSLCAPYL